MMIWVCTTFICAVVRAATPSLSGRCPSPSELRPALECFFGHRHGEGHQKLNALFAAYSDCPELFFYRAAGRWAEFQRRPEDEALRHRVEEEMAAAVREMERRWDSSCNDPNYLLALGGALGFEARLAQVEHRWWTAYRLASRGRDLLARAYRLDPTLADCLLGLGMYDYLLARAPTVARVALKLLAFSGDRERGLAELSEAAEHGTLDADEARLFLRIVWADMEHDTERALPYAQALRQKYPEHDGYAVAEARIRLAGGDTISARALVDSVWVRRSAGPGRSGESWTGDELFAAGEVFWAGGDRPRARRAYAIALESAEFEKTWRRTWCALRLGEMADGDRDREKAVAQYQRALTFPDHARAHATAHRLLAAPYSAIVWPPERP